MAEGIDNLKGVLPKASPMHCPVGEAADPPDVSHESAPLTGGTAACRGEAEWRRPASQSVPGFGQHALKIRSLNDDAVIYGDILHDANLVEASAGTGKTYSIQTIYLRMIVELGFSVESILVVTFTEAATKELRDRIRQVLRAALSCVELAADRSDAGLTPAPDSEKHRIKEILRLAPRKENGDARSVAQIQRDRLEQAVRDFDQAAIFTIHGFCARTLRDQAYESGLLFDTELVAQDDEALDEIVEDYYRRHFYPMSAAMRTALAHEKMSLEHLRFLARQRVSKPDAQFLPDETNADPASLARILAKIQNAWKESGDRVCENLRGKEPLFKGDMGEHLSEWLDELRAGLDAQATPSPQPSPSEGRGSRFTSPLEGEVVPTSFEVGTGEGMQTNMGEAKPHRACPDGESDRSATSQAAGITELPPRLIEILCRFATSSIIGSVRKGRSKATPWQIPDNLRPFFDACEELTQNLPALALDMKIRFLREIADAYGRRKAELNVQTYDDLLIRLREALRSPSRGAALLSQLRRRYQAALIDEFQDTDPIQYEIFRRIFIEAGKMVFLVGDPKQAIYSFRNGDIFTYCDAIRDIEPERQFALDVNYRSEANLIGAINRLFRDQPGKHTFVSDFIRYAGNLRARGKNTAESLLVNDEVDPHPFKLWFMENEPAMGSKDRVSDYVHELVASEIVNLIHNKSIRIGTRGINASDVAVLTLTHQQARDLQRALARRRVAAVLQSTGNLFETTEAEDMALILAALAEPNNANAVRSALATPVFGLNGLALYDCLEQIPLSELFRQAHVQWNRESFISAFNMILNGAGGHACLLRLERGERRLTNMLHLAEILHKTALEKKLGINGTINWLNRQLNPATREENEEHELRLETDRNAVQIMTVFKSKGLQFPIVFVPYMWSRIVKGDNLLKYHAPDERGRYSLNILLANETNEAKALEMRERLAEDVRLLYVALTRAIHRTYLLWGNTRINHKKAGDNAVAYVLHAQPSKIGDKHTAGDSAPEFPRLSEIDVKAELTALSADSEAHIELLEGATDTLTPPLRTQGRGSPLSPSNTTTLEVFPWDKSRRVDKSWTVSSFSSLAPHAPRVESTMALHDFDESDCEPGQEAPPSSQSLTIFDFPAGKKTGNCWHAILEQLDFTTSDAAIRKVVNETLALYHLAGEDENAREKQDLVLKMMKRVLSTPLPGTTPAFALKQVAFKDRISEMQFDFLLKDGRTPKEATTRAIADVIAEFFEGDGKAEFLEGIRHWNETFPRGLMTGFIDLVFRKDGKYYIADWKSNKLGGVEKDFTSEGIRTEMARNAYFLQYLFYSVAVHKFFKKAVAGYDYDTHFGGVFYVFLRGVDGETDRGIYFDRPARTLIERLSAVLSG